MSNSNLMRYKVVVCGDIVEVYKYKVAVSVGKSRDYDICRRNKDDTDELLEKRSDNLYRARQTVRRIVWCNQGKYTKFVTLTYSDTVLDVKKVKRDITTFVQAMRRLDYDMRYLYVLEHQKERGVKEGNEGCIHVHMLIFIDKFIPLNDLYKCWKHGFISIESIDDVRNLGAYVCKYITKDTFADFGNRCFSCSIGLDRGVIERFYTGCYSDSGFDVQGEEVLQALDIKYYNSSRYDYISPSDGSTQFQEVTYFQGTWKDKNIIKEFDPLYDIERQINDLHL